MKKRFFIMALTAFLLTSCSAENTYEAVAAVSDSVTETLETEASSETSETAAEAETETSAEANEVTMGTNPLDTAAAFVIESPKPSEEAVAEAAKRPEVTDYNLNYAENEFVSEEQSALAEYLYANWDEEQMRSKIETARTNMLAYDPDMKLDDYDVYNHEFCADFDGDGDKELFVYRSADIDKSSNWAMYRDLWYTDGEKTEMLYYGIGRAAVSGIFEVQNGVPLMYIVPDIVMGSPIQTAYCVTAEDGSADWYELPEDRCFMYDFKFDGDGNEKVFLFIYDADFGYENFMEAYGDPENFQRIDWVDGKLEIVSGYGAE